VREVSTFQESLATALGTIKVGDADAALVHLAEQYAEALDMGAPLKDVGPKYQSALVALGLGRGAVRGGEVHEHGVVTPLQRLRDAARARRGEAV
jgi:hypothetical protein